MVESKDLAIDSECDFRIKISGEKMMDNLLEQAIARRSALLKELNALEQFISTYQEARQSASAQARGPQLSLFTRSNGVRAKKSAELEKLMGEIEASILDYGSPMTRSQILEVLDRKNYEIEGQDKSKVLGTNIWRSRKFWNIIGHGYWPKSTPVPEKYDSLPKR